ncbi:TonB family protein [Hymenobacter negativus]|uniref:TonB family protein n=1 Tax=Hymenobacter negativus TaxID=2795026 RepID=A0ABS3QNC2_9BACT|nr:TonB family protein [Hymenobacter negativus]MBO2012279.1 TonB family protein [Hymenobacter negativus]
MKHLWLMLLTVALATGTVQAQTPNPASTAKPAAVADTTVYTYAEQMPQLPGGGGNAAICAAIGKELRFPPLDAKGQFPGSRMVVEFTVTKNGDVSNISIIKSLDSRLDAVVVRAIQTLPRLTPGQQAGVPVNVKIMVPITICLK